MLGTILEYLQTEESSAAAIFILIPKTFDNLDPTDFFSRKLESSVAPRHTENITADIWLNSGVDTTIRLQDLPLKNTKSLGSEFLYRKSLLHILKVSWSVKFSKYNIRSKSQNWPPVSNVFKYSHLLWFGRILTSWRRDIEAVPEISPVAVL